MLTLNYKNLQDKYSRPKKKKQSQATGKNFSASTWKDYKDWVKEQKLKEELEKKLSKTKKKKKPNNTKAKAQKAVRKAKNTLKSDYQKQLKHELWLKKRKTILERDCYQCLRCGSKCNLEVHHTKYYMDKYAWEYPNSTLVTLCRECHENVHQDRNNPLYPKYIKN